MSDFDHTYITWVLCAVLTLYVITLLWYTLSFIISYAPSRSMTEKDLNLSGTRCGIALDVTL